MENKKGAVNPVVVIGGVLVVAAIAVIAYYASTKSNTQMPAPSPAVNNETSVTEAPSASSYKDGTYQEIGEYTSPGGSEELDVTIVLKDGVVEDATVVSKATRPNSVRFQGEFVSGYKDQVIGKNIDDLMLTKVAGSSLSPKGFNDAIEKIKAEAKA